MSDDDDGSGSDFGPENEGGWDQGRSKHDEASNPDYDSSPRYDQNPGRIDSDNEELNRRRIGRYMGLTAFLFMGALSLSFFCFAVVAAYIFLRNYFDHTAAGGMKSSDIPLLELFMPFVPVGVFSLTGLVILITFARFTQAFTNENASNNDDYAVAGRVFSDVVGAIKRLGGLGGS